MITPEMITVEFAQEVVEYINTQRDAEDRYTTDDYEYFDNPAYVEWSDNLIVSNEVIDATEAVWESGYCDYVSIEDVIDALKTEFAEY